MIEQKGMTFEKDAFYYPFLLPLFLGGKRKEEKNNQSRGQKSCLSARLKLDCVSNLGRRMKRMYRGANIRDTQEGYEIPLPPNDPPPPCFLQI